MPTAKLDDSIDVHGALLLTPIGDKMRREMLRILAVFSNLILSPEKEVLRPAIHLFEFGHSITRLAGIDARLLSE